MRTVILVLVIAGAVFAGVYFLALRPAAGPETAVPPAAAAQGADGRVQRDAGEGGVEIEVTLGGPRAAKYETDRYTVFLVAFTTHSGDLSGYDLVVLSELRAGGKTLKAVRWVSISDDSHHRAGALVFPQVDESRPLELTIRDIAAVPARTFRWAP